MIGINEIYFYCSVTGYRLARIYTLRAYILGIAKSVKFPACSVYLGYT